MNIATLLMFFFMKVQAEAFSLFFGVANYPQLGTHTENNAFYTFNWI